MLEHVNPGPVGALRVDWDYGILGAELDSVLGLPFHQRRGEGPVRRILDAGDDAQSTAAIGAILDIDGKDAFEALHPTHGGTGFVAVYHAARPARHDAVAVFEVGRKHAVEAGEVESRPGYQGGQPGDEIQRFQHGMRRTTRKGCLYW